MMFKIGQKVAIKLFIHPMINDTTIKSKEVLEEYQASMSHFYAEEVYL